jgi:hypothetical protein
MLTLAQCDYLLASVKDLRAFKVGPRESIGAVREISREDPAKIENALRSSACPFKGSAGEGIRSALEGSARSRIYTSFVLFAYHASRCRYVPTSSIMALLPIRELMHGIRQEIALTFPDINAGSIQRISPRGYAALTDNGTLVFIQRGTVFRAFKEEMILRLGLHALCWASSDRSMPQHLRYKAISVPPGEIPRKLAENIARGAAEHASFVFYAKVLLPEIIENAADLCGIICSVPRDSGTSSEVDERQMCGICRDSMLEGMTRMLECGHVYHEQCITESIRECGNRCPECRFYIRVPSRLID